MSQYRFDHIHLTSPDPLKTVEFYQKILGATIVSSPDINDGSLMFVLNLGGIILRISNSSNEKQIGLVHFGIRTDHLSESVVELKSKGVMFTQEIALINPSLKLSFLLAPESVLVELLENKLTTLD